MRPHVLLIVMDTARADHLSCHGYGRQTSPCLDALAREGALFENAYTAGGWTLPSHASLFTALYPSAHGLNLVGDRLAAGVTTLAERLQRLGYRTVGITNNSFLGKMSGLCRGFETFIEPSAPFSGVRPAIVRKVGRRLHRLLLGRRWDIGARQTNALAVSQLAVRDRRPCFMFLNYMDTHQTYDAPAAYRHLFLNGDRKRTERIPQDVARILARDVVLSEEDFGLLRDLYDGQIRYLDFRLGELFERLRQMGLLDDTLVIVTSDHGENLGEHGLVGHLFSLHETILHVPLIIRHPKVFSGGLRSNQPVNLVDIVPTLLDLLGAEPDPALPGCSFAPGRGEGRRLNLAEYVIPQLDVIKRRFPAFDCSVYDRGLRAVREGDLKLIWSSRGDHELYDLRQDPAESRNLMAERRDEARGLAEALEEWAAATTAGRAERTADIDRETLERLSGLGYI